MLTDIAQQAEFISQFPITAGLFLDEGRVPAIGSVRKLPELADALELIAKHGRDAFYRGELAADMVDELTGRGGLHTLDDFANAAGNYVSPIHTDYRGYRLHECPPNGQGVIAILMMNMLRELPIDPKGPLTVERMHWEIEICRLAYAVRDAWVADPDQVSVDYEGHDDVGDVSKLREKTHNFPSVVECLNCSSIMYLFVFIHHNRHWRFLARLSRKQGTFTSMIISDIIERSMHSFKHTASGKS